MQGRVGEAGTERNRGIRNWLAEEGGMELTRPDKAEFIEAAQKVQKEFAEDRGPEFVELVEQIQAAAE